MSPDRTSGMIDIGRCYECGKEVDMSTAVADPNGKPLCRDCFNVLVRGGNNKQDNEEFI